MTADSLKQKPRYYECSKSEQTQIFVSGFRLEVGEACAVLIYHAAYSCNSLPTFRDNVSVSSSRLKKSKKKAGHTLGLTKCKHVSS